MIDQNRKWFRKTMQMKVYRAPWVSVVIGGTTRIKSSKGRDKVQHRLVCDKKVGEVSEFLDEADDDEDKHVPQNSDDAKCDEDDISDQFVVGNRRFFGCDVFQYKTSVGISREIHIDENTLFMILIADNCTL